MRSISAWTDLAGGHSQTADTFIGDRHICFSGAPKPSIGIRQLPAFKKTWKSNVCRRTVRVLYRTAKAFIGDRHNSSRTVKLGGGPSKLKYPQGGNVKIEWSYMLVFGLGWWIGGIDVVVWPWCGTCWLAGVFGTCV